MYELHKKVWLPLFLYCLKIWVGTLFLAVIFMTVMTFYKSGIDFSSVYTFEGMFFILSFSFFCSIPSFILFLGLCNVILYQSSTPFRKIAIGTSGLLIVFLSFELLSLLFGEVDYHLPLAYALAGILLIWLVPLPRICVNDQLNC